MTIAAFVEDGAGADEEAVTSGGARGARTGEVGSKGKTTLHTCLLPH
jgi:hypothetical protein